MRVVRLRAAGGPEQLAVEEADRPRPGPGRRSSACTRRRSPAASWNGRSTACRRSRPTSSPEWSRRSARASPASRAATRCSRSPRSTAMASPPTTQRCPPNCWCQAAGARARRERRDPAARAHRLAGAVRPRPARRGERVLIHGAAGNVGGFAVQLARAAGAHVIGTASATNLDFVLELGAPEAWTRRRVRGRRGTRRRRLRHRRRRAVASFPRRAASRRATGLGGRGAPRGRRVLHRRAESRPARLARDARR